MYFVTTDEVKQLLGITDAAQDGLIDALIPLVQESVLALTHNPFTRPEVCLVGGALTFAAGEPATISDGGAGFADAGFVAGMAVYVEGSFFNDGYYRLADVSAGALTLAEGEALVNESPSSFRPVSVFMAQIPNAVKLVCARMIGHDLQQRSGVAAEKIGNYSVTYEAAGKAAGYPESITGALKPFKKLKFGD